MLRSSFFETVQLFMTFLILSSVFPPFTSHSGVFYSVSLWKHSQTIADVRFGSSAAVFRNCSLAAAFGSIAAVIFSANR